MDKLLLVQKNLKEKYEPEFRDVCYLVVCKNGLVDVWGDKIVEGEWMPVLLETFRNVNELIEKYGKEVHETAKN